MFVAWQNKLIPVILILLKTPSSVQCSSLNRTNTYFSVYYIKLGTRFVLDVDSNVIGENIWRKDGKPKSIKNCNCGNESECIERICTYKKNPSLVFKQITLEDSGKYILEIIGSERKVFSFKLIVEEVTSVYTDCDDMSVYEGDNISCACQADNPNATISWNQNISIAKNLTVNDFTGILVLENVSRNQSGKYTCFAKHRDMVNTTSFSLNVLDRNSVARFKKTKIKYFKAFEETGDDRNQLILVCDAEGIPQPRYTIFHQGRAVKHGNMYIVDSSKKSSWGQYECLASNAASSDSRLLSLKESTGKKCHDLGLGIMLIASVNGFGSFLVGILFLYVLSWLHKKYKKDKTIESNDVSSNNEMELREASESTRNGEVVDDDGYVVPDETCERQHAFYVESFYQELSEDRETDLERYQSLNPIDA